MSEILNYIIFFSYIFLVLFIFSVAGYILLRKTDETKAIFYVIGLIFQIIWIVAYVIGIYSPELPDKVFWDTLIIVSLIGILVSYLLFSLEFNGIRYKQHKLLFFSIMGIALIECIPVMCFPYNPAFRYNYEIVGVFLNDDITLLYNSTGWYLNSLVAESLILCLIPIGLFIRNLFLKKRSKLLKKQSIMIISSFSIIIFQFVLYVWPKIVVYEDLLIFINLIGFALANFLIFIAVVPLQTFEVLPAANKTILDNIGDGYCIYDKNDELLDINQQLLDILGIVDRNDVIGKDPVDLFYQYPDLIELTSSQLNKQIEVSIVNSHFQVKKVFNFRKRQRYIGYIIIFHDITTRKEHEEDLEQKYHHAQKLESVGRLAGGIAHEFNNLLTIILGNTELIQLKNRADQEDKLLLGEISDAANMASRLTKQLLAIGRKNVIHLKHIDVNHRLQELKDIFNRLISPDSDITIQLKLDPKCGTIFVDMGMFDQILVNLVINSRDAMPSGGLLEISSDCILITEENKDLYPDAKNFDVKYARVRIKDNGIGMDDEVKKHLFEPFFTTKERGEGTGLGLSMVYGAVKQFQGFITVDSTPGKGTTIDVYIPNSANSINKITISSDTKIEKGNRELILVVEDDMAVRTTTIGMLKSLNYNVVSFGNASEAITYFKRNKANIDLLFTDIVMQGMKGNELANQLKKIDPHLKVLFVSGYTDKVIAKYGVLYKDTHFIAKPFSFEMLAQKISEILHS
jgi:PAS domain S-box-containing protein